jgi:hypothetical protein
MKLKWIIIGIVVLVASIAFMYDRPTLVPDELIGVWATSNPKYADRSLELSRVTVVFGTSKESVHVYFVSNVKKTVLDSNTLYTVYFHRLEGTEDEVSFYYSPENGGVIQFKNQKHIKWIKGKSKS